MRKVIRVVGKIIKGILAGLAFCLLLVVFIFVAIPLGNNFIL